MQERELAERWHRQVEGIWHGCPGVYAHDGQWQGTIQADRSIYVDENGHHLIRVHTKVDCFGALRARLETPVHLLRVEHRENKRVYEGPDFFGAGYPYGTLVLGNDYCVPWQTDNRVTVQLLPGGQVQAYSNVAYEGNTLVCVIAGLYRMSRDYETHAATRTQIASFREEEVARSKDVHILPRKTAGVFRGELETYSPNQELLGTTLVRWEHTPVTQYRCIEDLSLTGAVERHVRIERTRHENHHFYEDGLWGNGIGFGRALFFRGNFRGETRRMIGRDFQLEDGSLAVVWELWRADQLERVLHGVLKFEAR